ncbi:ribonuclease H-like domain-containing protein [Tanacetum coccineum]
MPIFKRNFSQELDLLEQHLTKDILSQTNCNATLTKLIAKFENAFNSEFKERMQKYTRFNAQSFQDAMICNMYFIEKCMLEIIIHQQRTLQLLKQKKLMQKQEDHSNSIQALKVDLVVIQNTCSKKEDSNSETASKKSVKESNLDSATKDVHAIKYKMSKAKERCMPYFRSLHLHLQVLSKEDLKGTRIEHGFKRAFMSLFGQDVDTFTNTMLLNVDQLQKQLNKDEFQKDGSMAAFWVVNNEFQKFIDSQFSLDYDSQMTEKYFDEYTGIEVKQFKDTLLQHMGNVKKFVDKRTRHQRQYNRMVNKRQMQMQESKIDMGKVVDVDLVVTESSGTESEVQDDSSMSENDTDADNAYIRPIYDEEPMAEALKSGQHGHILNEISNKAKIKKEIDAYETINIELEHSVAKLLTENEHLNKENETVKKHYKDLYDSIKIMRSKTIELTTSLLANNVDLKAQIQEKVVPTGKILASCTSKDDSESTNGSNVDIPNIHKCKQTLDLSACTSINVQKEQSFDLSAVVSMSSNVPTADASDKCQQQPDSTSSTSTLATTVTADGNFDLYKRRCCIPNPAKSDSSPFTHTRAFKVLKDCIWLFEQEQALGFSSVSTNTRMTVIKLKSGRLWVHGPIAPTKECIQVCLDLANVVYAFAGTPISLLYQLPTSGNAWGVGECNSVLR